MHASANGRARTVSPGKALRISMSSAAVAATRGPRLSTHGPINAALKPSNINAAVTMIAERASDLIRGLPLLAPEMAPEMATARLAGNK